jgi:dTDP-4-dehydrorhamnose 3,5-epimerase
MFELTELALPGVVLLRPQIRTDGRGRFVKLYHAGFFAEQGLAGDFAEHYITRSHRNVLRGLHFQAPPADHAKLVTCTEGAILDVVVDLRRDLPSYGHAISCRLESEQADLLHIPSGCAHGFIALSDQASTLYAVTSLYDPASDHGILWSSIDFAWPVAEPILSDRDHAFPALVDFVSPFRR